MPLFFGTNAFATNLKHEVNHYSWTYVAGEGRNTKVGLFHGNRSGHVLIYIGKKITVIDFKVFDSKEYTFFIDDELCRVKLERKGAEMYYTFEIDKKTDTPRNRARWALEKKHLRHLLIALCAFAVIIAIFVLFSNNLKHTGLSKVDQMLMDGGRETVGRVSIKNSQPYPTVTYHFVAQNQGFNANVPTDSQQVFILENGMPLETGDEFIVRYVPERPEVNRIYFGRPTEKQLETYQQRAGAKFLATQPDTPTLNVNCLMQTVLQFEGLKGLADIYFLETPATDNPSHNQDTFLKLTQSLAFQKALNDCRQQ